MINEWCGFWDAAGAAARRYGLGPAGSAGVRRVTLAASLHRRIQRLRALGPGAVLDGAMRRVFPARPGFCRQAIDAVRGRSGIEIGGPSVVFRHREMLPVYEAVGGLDNVNYATTTTWETGLTDGGHYRYDARQGPGRQWLREATALTGIADRKYAFVLSSHCLEHTTNPLGALREWRRVTETGGHLLLVLPDKTMTFDHKRPVTTIEHLREDFVRSTPEDDTTHLAEAIDLHDLARNPHIDSLDTLRAEINDNLRTRNAHHHVFDLALMKAVLEETGWRVIAAEAVRPIHLVALAVNDQAHT